MKSQLTTGFQFSWTSNPELGTHENRFMKTANTKKTNRNCFDWWNIFETSELLKICSYLVHHLSTTNPEFWVGTIHFCVQLFTRLKFLIEIKICKKQPFIRNWKKGTFRIQYRLLTMHKIKFRYSEKATKFWIMYHFLFDVT